MASRAAAALEKPLPSNLDAERSILGAILLDNKAITEVAGTLHSNDFFLPQHRHLFRAMLEIARRDVAGGQTFALDLVILCEQLQAQNNLEAAGGAAYVSALVDGMAHVSNVAHYVKIVKEKAALRSLIHASYAIQQRAFEGRDGEDEGVQAVYDGALKSLAALNANLPKKQMIVGGNGKLSYSVDEFLAQQFPPPEHLIEWIFSKSGSALLVAKPHHLKSWWTLALGLLATLPGTLLNKLNVPRPVRTLLVSVEDFPGQTQERMDMLLKREAFQNVDRELFRIVPRPIGGIDIMAEDWYARIVREIENHKADIVIFDVLRRMTKIDINSPKESALFCEQMERIRDITGASTVIVHHENRKEADIMSASAGSFNLPGWANSVIRFQRKMDEIIGNAKVSTVEIEVDNKFAPNPEPMRMVLDLASEMPVRLEDLEDAAGVADLREQLGLFWTVNDLSEVLGVHKSNGKRRLKKLIAAGLAEKAIEGKRGRSGGLARYQFVGAGA